MRVSVSILQLGREKLNHFHLELIHSAAKDLCLSVLNGVLLSTKRINFHSAAKERSPALAPGHLIPGYCRAMLKSLNIRSELASETFTYR